MAYTVSVSAMRIPPDYREQVTLDDGTSCVLRLVGPDVRPLLERGIARLSLQSSYRRFASPKTRLTDEELRYLTEIDNDHHLAIGAVVADAAGGEDGAGVARYVRRPAEPAVAEAAIVVADDYQGRGLGRLLLARLAAAAAERGVRRFRADVLADNAPMLRMLEEIAPDATFTPAGASVQVDIPLPPVDEVERAGALATLRRLLRSVASGRVSARDILVGRD